MENIMQVGKMGNYSEQIVKRKMSQTKLTALILGLCLIVFIIFLSVYLSGFFNWLVPVSLLCMGLGVYIIYYMIKNAGVEYEYTFVVGEMRIDKIKGKSKRKKVTVFDVKSIDQIGKFINPETGEREVDTSKYELILHAAEDDFNLNTYYMVIHDKIRQKPALLLYTPDERTLSMIQPYLSVELKKKFFIMKKEEEKKKSEEQSVSKTETTDETKTEKKKDKKGDKPEKSKK